MALLPHMLQSIEVLQLATADLVQFVEEQLQQNETLEALPPRHAEPAIPAPTALAEREDTGWQEWRRGPAGDADDGKAAFLANVAARGQTLADSVRQQLAFRGTPALLTDAVMLLVSYLDERGLLPFAVEDLAERHDAPLELLREAHTLLLSLEPRGIGAAQGIDAMLLQAAGDPDLATIERLLRDQLEALGRNKLPEVARDLQMPLDELEALLVRMRRLSPRPAAAFERGDDPPLRPDAFVWLHDGEVHVALDDASLPDLQVSAEYQALAGARTTAREVRDWLRPKLRSARDLIDAVQQRQATLLRVVEAVMRGQQPFLAKGRTAIKPLRMSDIADALGLHTSTVSRAIAGKSVQTDRGIFRLRDFFDGDRLGGAAIEGSGRLAIAEQIAELVAGEDKQVPLSDDDLVRRLGERGVRCARRTVTKHRQHLGIPSSYRRRRFGGA